MNFFKVKDEISQLKNQEAKIMIFFKVGDG